MTHAITEIAHKIVGWYKRRSYKIDGWDDAFQEAVLAVLLASRNEKATTLQLKAAASYAVRRHLYNAGSPVTHYHRPERLKGMVAVPLSDAMVADGNPEELLLQAEWNWLREQLSNKKLAVGEIR